MEPQEQSLSDAEVTALLTHHRDIIEVFENLQSASQDNHLPAFRRCTERGNDDQGHQRGQGRGRRRRGN